MTTILFSVAVLFVVVGLAAFARSAVHSGYEDDSGFHYGTPHRRRK